MVRGLNNTSPEKTYKQLSDEKMFNFTNYQGNANQNYLLEWLLATRQIVSAGEVVGKKEPSFTAGRNWTGTTTMENSMAVPQKTKNRVTIRTINLSSGYLPKKLKNIYLRHLRHTSQGCIIFHTNKCKPTFALPCIITYIKMWIKKLVSQPWSFWFNRSGALSSHSCLKKNAK